MSQIISRAVMHGCRAVALRVVSQLVELKTVKPNTVIVVSSDQRANDVGRLLGEHMPDTKLVVLSDTLTTEQKCAVLTEFTSQSGQILVVTLTAFAAGGWGTYSLDAPDVVLWNSASDEDAEAVARVAVDNVINAKRLAFPQDAVRLDFNRSVNIATVLQRLVRQAQLDIEYLFKDSRTRGLSLEAMQERLTLLIKIDTTLMERVQLFCNVASLDGEARFVFERQNAYYALYRAMFIEHLNQARSDIAEAMMLELNNLPLPYYARQESGRLVPALQWPDERGVVLPNDPLK